MKLASISSGSKGNCIFVEQNNTSILVDAGISKKRIEDGLAYFGTKPEQIDGIVVTHEHSDHIKGLGVFLRKYKIPVYATEKTIQYLREDAQMGTIDTDLYHIISKDKIFFIKKLQILPVHTSHDALDPVCYRFFGDGKSCAVITDLGETDRHLIDTMKGLDAALIESNHDLGMLQTGPYPYYLKQRIWGSKGHLSNEACGVLINQIISERLKHIILGHLSQENNYPELAFQAVRNEINFGNHDYSAEQIELKVASQVEPSDTIEF